MAVSDLARLFEALGSGSEDVACATLVRLPGRTGINVTETLAVPVVTICPKSQRTTWSRAQVPWLVVADTRTGFPENVATTLTFDTVFGPVFLILIFTTVLAPVVEDAGADVSTATSAGVWLWSCTTELRTTYTPLVARNARPS